jgi:hypothetical protein
MSDGLDEYKHDPMLWSSLVVLELNEFDIEDAVQCQPENVRLLVERSMDFITGSFDYEDLPVPSVEQVLEHALKYIAEWRSNAEWRN